MESSADPAVQRVAKDFVSDIERVSGVNARSVSTVQQAKGNLVIIGVLGQSATIDDLVKRGLLDVKAISGQWEAFQRVVIDRPYSNVAKALVIVGSDRRGAIYGTYDLSEQMGVSPWHWFADVPVQKHKNLFITAGSYHDAPKVKFRGFFINDEDPSFKTWAIQHFGGVNAKMYEHVFELLLRLKANYMWPAMWGKAFNDDDPQNMIVADQMGIVMGTSHHEPMMRAQEEWHRNMDKGITGGKWDYTSNAENLRAFWRGGIERMMSKGNGQAYDSLVTVGMRGDGDEAMAEGTATNLLEKIVTDQRRLIEEVTNKPANKTPQVWALYKEVQDYYDHGMKVPDDVTLLFADDNWGQIRRLPVDDVNRAGGYGVYYHFDYVGAPRNYKWLNTNQIEKTWQQMDLAYARGARALWIVNVGDIKPMEFPISFFMKQAWNPEMMTPSALKKYPEEWSKQTFGSAQAAAIADLVTRYSKFAARRKPELIDADTFMIGSLKGEVLDGGEFGLLVDDWKKLEQDMLKVKSALSHDQLAAYLQLVEYPIAAMSNLYQLFYNVALNRRLAASKDSRANFFADAAEKAFRRDQELSDSYHQVNGGKWSGMMLQIHMGYRS
ncbi:MAG TPA: glycosyl hydrolase 115 family protein, partial [Steroidobacteraceae bacterium]|nr:glycosyl hydrolase 115 family protein [Steroidobacteraceae bacterium]